MDLRERILANKARIRALTPAVHSVDEDWRSRWGIFKETKDGQKWVSCLANAALVLDFDPNLRGRIRFDEFRERIIASGVPWRPEEHVWTDEDTGELRIWLHRYENKYGLDIGRGDLDSAVAVCARKNAFHPLRRWLSSLEWDGVERLDRLFVTYFGAEDNAYTRGIGAKWAISAIARAFKPGCQADYAPVLEGEQGKGKSTGLQTLVGDEWFFNSGVDLTDLKAAYETIQGKWIIELGELDGLTKADITRVKAFLTSAADHYRASYARYAVTHPRQCVFVASTNEGHYLKDPTGNRRFWPVKCGDIDRDAIRRDREQLWAEARVRYERGEEWKPDLELTSMAVVEQGQRYQADVWEAPVSNWLGPRDGVTTYEVLTTCLGIEKGRLARADEMRCATVLRRLGLLVVKQKREGNTMVRRYYRVTPSQCQVVTEVVTKNQSSLQPDKQTSQLSQPTSLKVEDTNSVKYIGYRGVLVTGREGCDVVTASEPPPSVAPDATSGVHRTAPSAPETGPSPDPTDRTVRTESEWDDEFFGLRKDE